MSAQKKTFGLVLLLCLVALPALAVDEGTWDPGFDTDGFNELDYQGGPDQAVDVAVDSQGRIVVGMIVSAVIASGPPPIYDFRPVVARYLADGTLDTSFGNSGTVNLGDAVMTEMADRGSLIILPSGNILFGFTKYGTDGDFKFYELGSNGIPTDVNGVEVAFDLGSEPSRLQDRLYDMTLLADGRIALVGAVDRQDFAALDRDFGIAVLEKTGGAWGLDTAFDSDGKNTCYFDLGGDSGRQDDAWAVAENANGGTIIVGGSAFVGDGLGDGKDMAVCEFNTATGALLRNYHEAGSAVVNDREEIRDLVVLPDGKILCAGMMGGPGGYDFAILKLTRDIFFDFVPDVTFGLSSNGWAYKGFDYLLLGNMNDHLARVVVEPDGGILAAGTLFQPSPGTVRVWVLARFTSTGLLDTEFGVGGGGWTTYNLHEPAYDNILYGLARQDDGMLILAGDTHDVGAAKAAVGRVYGRFVFVDGFESGGMSAWSTP